MLAFRRLAGLVAFAFTPLALTAQEPPSTPRQLQRAADSTKSETTKADKTRVDSSTRERIANMKVWVDSAAGAPPVPRNGADSLVARSPAFVDTVVRRGETVVYRELRRAPRSEYRPASPDGERAPETASALPAIALGGVIALLVGAAMVRGDDRSRDGA